MVRAGVASEGVLRGAWLALLGLGLLLLLPAGTVLIVSLWRRVRLRLTYSPGAARWAAALSALAVLLIGSGAAVGWFTTLLSDYAPASTGEPVGVVAVHGGQVLFRPQGEEGIRVLGRAPGGRFVLVGDALIFPRWMRVLGLGVRHRIREVRPAPLFGRPGPPEGDRLYALVSSGWFPGTAVTYATPSLTGTTRTELRLLEHGGYAATPAPPPPRHESRPAGKTS